MSDSFLGRMKRGASVMVSGMSEMGKDRDVKKTYRYILLGLFLLTLLLDAAGIWSAWTFVRPAADASSFVTFGFAALRYLSLFLVVLLAPLVAITLCNLLAPVFSEIPFLAGMRCIDRERGVRLGERPGLGNAAAMANSLRRFGRFLALSLGCFLLGFVPVVGTFTAPALQFYFAAKTIGWEMMDPYFDKLGIPWDRQKVVVRRYAPELLGLGAVCLPLLAIPIIGPTFFGLLQASAARFVVSVFPEGDTEADLIPSGA